MFQEARAARGTFCILYAACALTLFLFIMIQEKFIITGNRMTTRL